MQARKVGWKLGSSGDKVISEINITPLTDVMLVLLVIFMVTTPLIMMESFKIRLPKAVTATSEPGTAIVVSISEKGLLEINGRDVTMDNLYSELSGELRKRTNKTVLIKGDRYAIHGTVVRVLDTAKRAGAEKLSIATEPEDR